MKYQRDYYINCALELRLKEDSILKEKKNILVNDFPDTMDLTRYYTLSGVANRTYGDGTHLLLNGTRDLYLLYDKDTRRTRVLPEDYDLKNNHLEGIIDFDIILSGKDTLILKLYELFDRKKFDNYLNSRSKYTFTPLSEKEELYYKNLYYGEYQ